MSFVGWSNLCKLVLLVCFALARLDPGYPAGANFPQSYDQYLRIKYGAAFGLLRIYGDYVFSFRVENQPNRNAKFQVILVNQTNFDRYMAGNSYFCINPESCGRITTDPVTGGFNGYRASNQSVWLVVQNRNFVDDANIRVAFRGASGGATGATGLAQDVYQTTKLEGGVGSLMGHGHH